MKATMEGEFRSKIVKRNVLEDGCEEITLECGHLSIAVGGVFGDSMYCGQCVNDWVEEHRAEDVG